MARNVGATTGGSECAMKFVTGIFHIILLKYCLQATLIKRTVVCYKRQAFYFSLPPAPTLPGMSVVVSIPTGESVDLSSPICIIIGGRLNKTVESVNNHTVTNYYDADTTHAGASAISCFKVYCYKKSCIVSHSYTVHTSHEIQSFIDAQRSRTNDLYHRADMEQLHYEVIRRREIEFKVGVLAIVFDKSLTMM